MRRRIISRYASKLRNRRVQVTLLSDAEKPTAVQLAQKILLRDADGKLRINRDTLMLTVEAFEAMMMCYARCREEIKP